MAHLIEEARSNRSSCKSCREPIGKGVHRFGFDEFAAEGLDRGHAWYHLECAAARRPQALKETLAGYAGELPNRAELEALLKSGAKPAVATSGRPAAHVEPAPTGRSKCIGCGKPIEKDSPRVAVQRELSFNGMTRMGAAYVHPSCARAALTPDEFRIVEREIVELGG